MGFMIYFVINIRFLRCLRFFEKWSVMGKIGKNREKWGKKAEPESPYIHYCCAFPLGAQDHGNSTTTGQPVSG